MPKVVRPRDQHAILTCQCSGGARWRKPGGVSWLSTRSSFTASLQRAATDTPRRTGLSRASRYGATPLHISLRSASRLREPPYPRRRWFEVTARQEPERPHAAYRAFNTGTACLGRSHRSVIRTGVLLLACGELRARPGPRESAQSPGCLDAVPKLARRRRRKRTKGAEPRRSPPQPGAPLVRAGREAPGSSVQSTPTAQRRQTS
jgi:hypothetical protein